jgi:hypothetical protein
MNRPDGRPWRKYVHQATGLEYEEIPDGRVRVVDRDGRSGIFRSDGRYIEGEITQANQHMLVWCGGQDIPSEFRYQWVEVPIDPERPSGWPESIEKSLNLMLNKP